MTSRALVRRLPPLWSPVSLIQRLSGRVAFLSMDRACIEATLERGKDKLGSISKQGVRYLRSLFTAGALAVIRYAKIHGTKHRYFLFTVVKGGAAAWSASRSQCRMEAPGRVRGMRRRHEPRGQPHFVLPPTPR
jgi:hypothetical protein